MGRRVTWLVVGAVAALAVAAVAEALRGLGETEARPGEPPQTTTRGRPPATSSAPALPISGRQEVAALLERAQASGTLYFGDRSCRLRTLVLPKVEWRAEPDRPVPCRFTVDAAGEAHPDGVRIEPVSGRRAVCHEGGVDVVHREGAGLASFRGACAPAWTPDGSLSFVRDGELVLALDGREERVLLSRADVARALGPGARLLEVAWLEDDAYAAVARRDGESVLAVSRHGELASEPSFTSARIDGLRTAGGRIAARTLTSGPAITFLSGRGREILTVERGHSVSWAPGGSAAAVAAGAAIVFVDPARRKREPLALVATDLEWR